MSYYEELSDNLKKIDQKEFHDKYETHESSEEIYERTVQENINNRKSVISSIKNINEKILQDNWEGKINQKTMDGIFKGLQNDADITQMLYRRNFLEEIILFKINSEYNVSSVSVPQIIILSQEKSRIPSYKFTDIKKHTEIKKIFKQLLLEYDSLKDSDKMALMCVSAAMHGGIMAHKDLLLFSNMSMKDIETKGDKYWVNISYDARKTKVGLVKRYYLDPITLQLVRLNMSTISKEAQCYKSWGLSEDITKKSLSEYIEDLFIHVGEFTPKNTTSFLSILKTAKSLALPSYVLDYAAGKNISYSLNVSAHKRFLNGGIIKTQPTSEKSQKRHNPFSKSDKIKLISKVSESEVNLSESIVTLKIAELIKNDELPKVRGFIKLNINMSSSLRYLTEWCLALREGDAPGRSKNNVKTTLQSFNRLCQTLPAFINGGDIVSMDSQVLADKYDRILEYEGMEFLEKQGLTKNSPAELISYRANLNDENNNKENYLDGVFSRQSIISKELKTFHEYMVSIYKVDKIKFEDLDGFVSKRHSVNANIVMPNEYVSILNALWPSQCIDQRLEFVRYVIVVLGYRLGLRRMEILQLRLCDIRGSKFMDIKISVSDYGGLKSHSAKRWLPLYDLLTENECLNIISWVNLRRSEVIGDISNYLLFASAVIEDEQTTGLDKFLSISSTYDVIHSVMRKVTGDDDIIFHCFRHSFVSWHLLFQEAERIPSIIDSDIFAFENTEKINIYPRNFKKLLNYNGNSGKILYQLCVLVGHSTPFMTLLHYCHFMDFILYNWMRQSVPSFNKTETGVLLGLKEKSIYEKLKNINTTDDGEYSIQDCMHLSKKSLLNVI